MLGTRDQVTRWQLAAIIAAPFVVVWMLSAVNPLVTLFVLLIVLDIGAGLAGADSRSRGDWRRR
jgi:hypothetical protein